MSRGKLSLKGNLAWTCALALAGLLLCSMPAVASALPPSVDSESTSAVNSTGATLEAQVNPNNQATTYTFEYAANKALVGATKLPGAEALPAEFGDRTASVSTGAALAPGITYFYRVVATNATPPATKGSVQSFTTVPTPNTDPVDAITATTATLHGHLTLNSVDTQYVFEYKNSATECTGETTTPTADAGTGSGTATVSVPIAGLLPHHEYAVCFSTSNAFGSERGSMVTFMTASEAPLVESASLLDVSGDSATFQGQLNPTGAATTYKFEYGPSTSYGATVPVPEGSAGASSTFVTVEAHAHGLLLDTSYHYHLVATNALGTTAGPDQTFTTQTLGGELLLPDSRSWELVSPPDKRGANLLPIEEQGVIQASATGNALTYIANGATETKPQGSSNAVQVFSTRDPSGWTSRDIAIAHDTATGHSTGRGYEYRLFSTDLSLGVVQPFGGFMASLSAEASEQTAYLRTNYLNGDVVQVCGGSCYRPLVTGKPGYANVPPGTVFGVTENGEACPPVLFCGPEFVGATPDLSHVVLNSAIGLMAGTSAGLYEWAGGRLTFIGKPLGAPPKEAVRAISDDGSRVVFEGAFEGHNGLLVRDLVNGTTAQVDESIGGGGEFWGASSDGSKVFFTNAGSLYEYNVGTTTTTSLVPEGGVRGVAGISSDGSYVYFAAEASGTCALYARHGGTIKLVTALSCQDSPDWGALVHSDKHTARVSPSGEWLAFMSQAKLKGYDNRDVVSGEPDEEVYLYHAASGVLVCASCNPTGARPKGVEYSHLATLGSGEGGGGIVGGDEVWPATTWIAANVPGWTPYRLNVALYQSRYLSDSGRLFFNSSDTLVPQDVNGTEDVYQYEPSGVGGCTSTSPTFSERSDGCVGLISSGTSAGESAFLDASESGGDVFFLTSARLSGQDVDTSVDVYDAHACTDAAPCFPVPASQPPPCSTGDSCKPSATPQPDIFGAPASATFSGAGNLVPPTSVAVPLTNRQKLARALKACKKRPKKKRAACEKQARRVYGLGHGAKRAAGTNRRAK